MLASWLTSRFSSSMSTETAIGSTQGIFRPSTRTEIGMNRRDDLRATEESIRRDTARVEAIEDEKESLDPSDPRVAELADHVERTTAGLHDKAVAERELSEPT
jgi:hypothetical protein